MTQEYYVTLSFVSRRGCVDQNPVNRLKYKITANQILFQSSKSYNCNHNPSIVLKMLMEYYHYYLKKKKRKKKNAFEEFSGKEFSLQIHLTVFTFISSNNIRLSQKIG